MKAMIKAAHAIFLWSSKKALKQELGEKYPLFKQKADLYMKKYYPQIPEIGRTIFSNSYYFASCYFFYFPAFKDLGYSPEEAGKLIWKINESMVRAIPPFLRPLTGWYYTRQFRSMGPEASEKSKQGQLHPDDWKVTYTSLGRDSYEVDIYECFVVKMAKRFGQMDLFPFVCRMDYLFSHYFHQGFHRTRTLGDGDHECNCRWTIPGECDWPVSDPSLK